MSMEKDKDEIVALLVKAYRAWHAEGALGFNDNPEVRRPIIEAVAKAVFITENKQLSQ